MKRRTLLMTLVLAASLGGCIVSPPPRGRAVAVVDIDVRPPPPRVVEIPATRVGYVWAPGYWRWNGHNHVWIDGKWMREKRGWRWEPARWEERHGRWHFEEGHWEH
ncbi:MAG TPA: YXWGXW repeat-containing protein [Steroidobacteraceae bacterium]|jgi:hypothetical protein